MTEVPHNDNDNLAHMSDEEKSEMLRHYLAQAKHLTQELGGISEPFADIDAPPATGEMETASDLPEIVMAVHSLDTDTKFLNTAETVVEIIEYVAKRLGFATF